METSRPAAHPTPDLSVLVPTHGRPAGPLGDLTEAVLNSIFPWDPRRTPEMNDFLVVGENVDLRESLGVELRSRGHLVTLVSTAADAFRLLRNTPVHTVIVLGNETDVAAEISSRAATPDVRHRWNS